MAGEMRSGHRPAKRAEQRAAFEAEMGRTVRARREALGWSRQRLADEAGLSLSTAQRVEEGEGCVAWVLACIAEALDETMDGLAPVVISNDDEEAAE